MGNPTVAEFWRQQNFAYLETYSFNRGPASEADYERLSQEIAAVRQELQTARYMDLAKLRRKLRELEQELEGGKCNILWSAARLSTDFTARKIATLASDAGMIRHLTNMFEKAVEQEGFFMCPPIYRDALVFYNDQAQRVQVLNICFECQMMATAYGQLIEANFDTYDALQETLMQLGHPIDYR